MFFTKSGFLLDDGASDDELGGEIPQDPEFWKQLREQLREFHNTMKIEGAIRCDDVWSGARREIRANGLWSRLGYLFMGLVFGLMLAGGLSPHWIGGLTFAFALCCLFCSRLEGQTRISGSECARGLQLGMMVLTNSAKVVR
jgi:hypothetical protein